MSSLTSSYAGALILASMAALGAAYLGNSVPASGPSEPTISPLVTPPSEPSSSTVPSTSEPASQPTPPATEPTPPTSQPTPPATEPVPPPTTQPSPVERPTLSEEEARRKLKCVVSDEAVDAMFKFVKTPVKDWSQIGATTARLSVLVGKTMTHPDRCPAVMARICALVFNKYSQMVKAIRDQPYDDVGSVWYEFSELVDELPDCPPETTQSVNIPTVEPVPSSTPGVSTPGVQPSASTLALADRQPSVPELPAPVVEPVAEPVPEPPAPVSEPPAPVSEPPVPVAEPVAEPLAPVPEPPVPVGEPAPEPPVPVPEPPVPVAEPAPEPPVPVPEPPAPAVEPVAEPPVSVVEPAPEPPAPAPQPPTPAPKPAPDLSQLFPFRALQRRPGPPPAVDAELMRKAEELPLPGTPINTDIYREPGEDARIYREGTIAPTPRPAGVPFDPTLFAQQVKTYLKRLRDSGTPESEIRRIQNDLLKQYERELRSGVSRGLLSNTMANTFIGDTRTKICGGRRTTARRGYM